MRRRFGETMEKRIGWVRGQLLSVWCVGAVKGSLRSARVIVAASLVVLGCESRSFTMPVDDGAVVDVAPREDSLPADGASDHETPHDVSADDIARADMVSVDDVPTVDAPAVDVPTVDAPAVDVPSPDASTDAARGDVMTDDVPVDASAPADAPAGCGGAPACAAGLTCCGGACVDTRSSTSHCGACGRSCDSGQVCASGLCSVVLPPSDLRIDVPTFAFAGTLTMRSPTAPWARGCLSEAPASIALVEVTNGTDFTLPLQCAGEGAPFRFSTRVVPGVYRIRLVTRQSTTLVGGVNEVIDAGFDLRHDRADVAFDVVNAAVSGTFTVNGAPAMDCTSTYPHPVELHFLDAAGHTIVSTTGYCARGAPERFTVRIPPGTYRVNASNVDPTNPGTVAWADSDVVIAGDRSDLTLNVRLFTVSGTITMNGTTPLSGCSGSSPRATISFTAPNSPPATFVVPCGTGAFNYTALLGADTYQVRVQGGSSTFPRGVTLVEPALVVDRNLTRSYDVRTFPVQLTIPSVTPSTAWVCSTGIRAHFVDAARGQNVDLPVVCGTRPTFSGSVFSGTYDIGVEVAAGSSSQIRLLSGAVVTSSRLDLAASLVTQHLSGRITWDDTMTYACPFRPTYWIAFGDARTLQGGFTYPVCAGTSVTYQIDLFPGTYRPSLGEFDLPLYGTRLFYFDEFTPGPSSTFDLTVRGVAFSASLLENGMIPRTICESADSAVGVKFVERTNGTESNFRIPCHRPGESYPFTGKLLPGVYRVSVSGIGHSSFSPTFEVYPALRIM